MTLREIAGLGFLAAGCEVDDEIARAILGPLADGVPTCGCDDAPAEPEECAYTSELGGDRMCRCCPFHRYQCFLDT